MTMRRIGSLLLLLAALALLPPVAVATSRGQVHPAALPPPIPGIIVSAAGVNIRTCPRVDCQVRAVVLLGERVFITGEAVDGFVPVEWGGVSGFAYDLYIASAERGTPELRHGTPGCNRVALIFNVGVGYEPRLGILDWLKGQGVPATVFPMGWWAAEHPDLLAEIARAGFPIGSHGDQRVELTSRSDAEIAQDIRAAAAAIERVIGAKPEPYFTPYAAAMDERVRGLVARAGYLPVAWNVSADDWNFGVAADDVFMRVVPNVTDGAIVELHLDAPASAEATAVAVPWIVERLKLKGYRFVTIPEMARPCA